jgi:hypothetical protein
MQELCLSYGVINAINFLHCSIWSWKGYSIRYQYAGNRGPALVLVHGFGANRSTSLTFASH